MSGIMLGGTALSIPFRIPVKETYEEAEGAVITLFQFLSGFQGAGPWSDDYCGWKYLSIPFRIPELSYLLTPSCHPASFNSFPDSSRCSDEPCFYFTWVTFNSFPDSR